MAVVFQYLGGGFQASDVEIPIFIKRCIAPVEDLCRCAVAAEVCGELCQCWECLQAILKFGISPFPINGEFPAAHF